MPVYNPMMVPAVEIENLCSAVRELHGCEAVYVQTVPVHERMPDGTTTVWKGDVAVFDLISHPKATRAYAWSHFSDDTTENRRYVAVLHVPPVDSPAKAVRAAIVAEWRKRS